MAPAGLGHRGGLAPDLRLRALCGAKQIDIDKSDNLTHLGIMTPQSFALWALLTAAAFILLAAAGLWP